MDPNLRNVLDMLFRWTHVVAGIMWIGHLYFFNFVNAQVAKTYDADSKKKVVPELMPRALYWFRWGAFYTWLSGFLLAGLVYYMGNDLVMEGGLSKGAGIGLSMLLIVLVFFIYDAVWKAFASKETAGVVVSFLLVAALVLGLWQVFKARAVYIHVGMLFGTIMAMNVWMRIWPNQRKIIAAIKGGTAPDGALVALAGLRSKQNTYMSVPLVLMMVSNHFGLMAGNEYVPGWVFVLLFVLAGWGVTKLLYLKSAGPAPARFE